MEPKRISEILSEVEVGKRPREEKEKQKKQLAVMVQKKRSNTPVPMQTMELSLVFNTSPDERKQRWCQRFLKDDYYVKSAAPTANDPDQPGLIREEDLNTLLVCFLLLKHSRIKPSKYAFETTPYQITKFFGEDIGGRQYADLKESLGRLQANRISTNFWWDTVNGERAIKNDFHFLNSVREGEEKSLRISLSGDIVESLEHGYVKFLTESSLKGMLKLRGYAKVLALFLLKLLGYKPRQDLNLQTVLKYLGVEDKYNRLPRKYFNRNVRKYIISAMEKATSAIGLRCAYDKEKQQFHLCKVGSIKQIEAPEEEVSGEGPMQQKEEERTQAPLLIQTKNDALSRLADIGVHDEMIAKIFSEFSIDEIGRQIEWLPYRKSDNPAGLIVSAIYGRWDMPAGYEQKREEALRSRV